MKQILSFSKWSSAVIFTSLVVFTSCKKDSNSNASDPDPSITVDAAQSDATAAAQFDDVFNITMGVQASDAGEEIGLGTGAGVIYKPASPSGTLSPDSASRCFTVTVSPKTAHVFPKVVTIDFGNGCQGKDGKLRKGKIITVFTGPIFIPGSKASTTFDHYVVDSFKVEGTHTVENTSTSNKKAWSVKIVNGKVTNTETGFWRKRDGAREHQQTEGNGTPLYLLDDVFEITGNATGSNSNGNSWASETTGPLVRKYSCQWLVKGGVKISRHSNTISAVLDYGDGSCDNKATITINGVSYLISLR